MKIIKKKIFDYIDSSGFILKKKNYFNKYESIPSIDRQQKKILSVASKFSMTSKIRQHTLINLLNYIFKNKITGDLVECGTWLGGNLIIFDKIKKKHRSKKKIYGYDTFYGMPKPKSEDKDNKGNKFINSYKELNNRYYSKQRFNISKVKNILQKNKVNLKNTRLIEGKIEETLKVKKTLPKKISLLRLDTDWYESTLISLKILYPKLVKNGVLIIDDYGWNRGCKKATDKFFGKNNNFFRIDHESIFLIK